MAEQTTSHDKLFKTAFEVFLKDLVELFDPEVAVTLYLDRARFLPRELFVDFRKEGHVEPDLVAEARTRDGEPQTVLVHIDVEGKFLETIDERMWRYAMHLRIKFKRPVVTLVVFLRGGAGGIEVREVVESVGPLEVNRFRYLAFGLSQSLAEDYVERPQALAAALAALMRSEIWDRVERKVRCMTGVKLAQGVDDNQRWILARIIDTYIQLDSPEHERYLAALRQPSHKEVYEMVVTWEEAVAKSEARGAVKTKREDILRIAQHHFGSLPIDFEKRVRSIEDLARLNRVFDQILNAAAIDDVDLG